MRIKLHKSEDSIRSFLGPALDPDVVKKLHESRQKIEYYYDPFERIREIINDFESEGDDK